MTEFKRRYTELENKKQKLKHEWLEKLCDTEEYQALEKDLKDLRDECEKVGHVRGTYWDNGIGWAWYYCANCNARFDIRSY